MDESGVLWSIRVVVQQGRGMPVFIGTSYPKLDEKFRLILPAKFRDRLAGGVVLAKSQEHCVAIYTKAQFMAEAEQITKSAPIGTPEYRNLKRFYFGPTDDQTPDGQGRILITQDLRDWANLGRELIVTGVGTHLEIWNPTDYAALMAANEETFANYSAGEVKLS